MEINDTPKKDLEFWAVTAWLLNNEPMMRAMTITYVKHTTWATKKKLTYLQLIATFKLISNQDCNVDNAWISQKKPSQSRAQAVCNETQTWMRRPFSSAWSLKVRRTCLLHTTYKIWQSQSLTHGKCLAINKWSSAQTPFTQTLSLVW